MLFYIFWLICFLHLPFLKNLLIRNNIAANTKLDNELANLRWENQTTERISDEYFSTMLRTTTLSLLPIGIGRLPIPDFRLKKFEGLVNIILNNLMVVQGKRDYWKNSHMRNKIPH